MSRMVRKQIYIDRRHNALLKRLAKRRQVSEAEIIRQALEREALTQSTRSLPTSRSALEALVKVALARRQRVQEGDEPYRWNRIELYDERLARYDRPTDSPAKGATG